MNILFFVTGIGYGHTIRSYAIIKEILKKDSETEIRIVGYKNSYSFFKKKFPTISIRGSYVPDESGEWSIASIIKSNLTLPVHWAYELIKLRKVVKEFKPDLIVSDFEYLGILLGKLTKTRCISIFNFNPKVYEDYIEENKISESEKMQQRYVDFGYSLGKDNIIPTLLGNQRNTKKFRFVSPIVRDQPAELPDKNKLMKSLKLKKEPIIVILGGSNFGAKIMRKLVDIMPLFKDEQFIIFGYRTYSTNIKKNVVSYIFKPNVLEYLKVSKGVITLAGHNTLSECLVYRKPMLLFPVKNQIEQQLNAYELEREDLALVKEQKNFSDETMRKHLKEFMDKIPKLQKNLDKIKVKGSGAKEVADYIFNDKT